MTPKKTHYRAIFLSDVHLGSYNCQKELLLDFLNKHSADNWYLVGDFIDGWKAIQKDWYWTDIKTKILYYFFSVGKKTKVVYLAGNHDEFLRDFISLDIKFGHIEILETTVHVSKKGLQYLVIHGDVFDQVVMLHKHKWIYFIGDRLYTWLMAFNRTVNKVRRFFGYEYWSLSAFLKMSVKRAVNFISSYEKNVAMRCVKEGYDGIICGHIHHPEIKKIEGIEYMNIGDWVESCTALVEDMDGNFKLIKWSKT
jgi:UDP-2,3-diacylglucosamine pyrophosphatase LpxH